MSELPVTFRSAFRKYSYVYPFILLFVFVPIQWRRVDTDRDTYAYFIAAEKIRADDSPYEPHPSSGPLFLDSWYYLYPPFLASVLALGPDLEYVTFARLWFLLILAGYWVFSASVGKMALGRTTLEGTLVAGAAIGFLPGVMNALNMGQADVLVWAMAGLALGYPGLRGIGFMGAALTKVNGIWPAAVAIWREGRSALSGALAAIGLAVGAAVLALGPEGFVQESFRWFRHIVPVLAQGQLDPAHLAATLQVPFGSHDLELPTLLPHNFSIPFAPLWAAHVTGVWTPEPGPLPLLLRIYLSGTAIAAPVAAGWLFRRQPVELHCALVLSAALLFSPILRATGLPILLLPLILYRPRLFHGRSIDYGR